MTSSGNQFFKYHALGNDYIVLDPKTFGHEFSCELIQRLCARHTGLGSDGILYGPLPAQDDKVLCSVRIFNPDGSEAEKSGNGLRIFCRYLYDQQIVDAQSPFLVKTLGGVVNCTVLDAGEQVEVDMGRVSFKSSDIPVRGENREVLNEQLLIGNDTLTINAATIGNPHCVLLVDQLDIDEVRRLGSQLENHEMFPNRTNVQFMQILNREEISIEIWERGAGYTLASGSSASACAACARRLGLVDSEIVVRMPGGNLTIQLSDGYDVVLTGPVMPVAEGTFTCL